MRKRAKNFLITTELHEVVVIRTGESDWSYAFCPFCAREVEVLSFDAAVRWSGSSGRDLVRRIESGAVHPIDTAGGRFGVCRSSLEEEKVRCL